MKYRFQLLSNPTHVSQQTPLFFIVQNFKWVFSIDKSCHHFSTIIHSTARFMSLLVTLIFTFSILYRNIDSQMFFKICITKLSQILKENTCHGVSFFQKLQVWRPTTLSKRDSSTGGLLWNLQNFLKTTFHTERIRWRLLTVLSNSLPLTD